MDTNVTLDITREGKVALFNAQAGNKSFSEGGDPGLQVLCFAEELAEFNEALAGYLVVPNTETRKELIKEWADVQVTLSNFAWFFEFNGEEAFNRVHENNMTKFVNGQLFKNSDGKVMKPEGYVKADMEGL